MTVFHDDAEQPPGGGGSNRRRRGRSSGGEGGGGSTTSDFPIYALLTVAPVRTLRDLRIHQLAVEIECGVTTEPNVDELADARIATKRNDAVHPGRLTHRPPDQPVPRPQPNGERIGLAQRPPLFDEHAHDLSDAPRTRALRSPALRIPKPQQPPPLLPLRNLIGQIRPRRPVLTRIHEEADTIELGALDPILELRNVLLGLTRETDDERRSHGHSGHALPKILDDLHIPS